MTWLLEGLHIRSRYTRTSRRIEKIDGDDVHVSYKGRNGKKHFDIISKASIEKYWMPYRKDDEHGTSKH